MPRPANYPLPLVAGSRRPSMLRCESCFHIGAAVRFGGRLLCGACFFERSMSEEARRLESEDRSSLSEGAYDHVA
jgi:hypothetical protein